MSTTPITLSRKSVLILDTYLKMVYWNKLLLIKPKDGRSFYRETLLSHIREERKPLLTDDESRHEMRSLSLFSQYMKTLLTTET